MKFNVQRSAFNIAAALWLTCLCAFGQSFGPGAPKTTGFTRGLLSTETADAARSELGIVNATNVAFNTDQFAVTGSDEVFLKPDAPATNLNLSGASLLSTYRLGQTDRVAIIERTNGSAQIFSHVTNAFPALINNDRLLLIGKHQVIPGNSQGILPAMAAPLQLTSLTNVVIMGWGGAEIYGPGEGDIISIKECEHIRITSLTIRGDTSPETSTNLFAAVHITYPPSRHLTFDNLTIRDVGGQGIAGMWAQAANPGRGDYVEIHSCTFTNIGTAPGISEGVENDGTAVAGGGHYWDVHHNNFLGCSRGVEIYGEGRGWNIHDNLFRNTRHIAIALFAIDGQGRPYDTISIKNNTVLNSGTDPGSFLGHAIYIGGGTNIVLSGNECYGGSAGGISVASGFPTVSLENVRLDENIVSGFASTGISVGQGTMPARHIDLVSNTVSSNGTFGISAVAQWVTVANNNVFNNGTTNVQNAGISVGMPAGTPTIAAPRVIDNLVLETRLGNEQQANGILLASGTTNALVRGNVALGNYNLNFSDIGTGVPNLWNTDILNDWGDGVTRLPFGPRQALLKNSGADLHVRTGPDTAFGSMQMRHLTLHTPSGGNALELFVNTSHRWTITNATGAHDALSFNAVSSGSGVTNVLRLQGTNASFAVPTVVSNTFRVTGTLTLGNAAQAETPTATHTLLITDSTGQAYRVLAVPVP